VNGHAALSGGILLEGGSLSELNLSSFESHIQKLLLLESRLPMPSGHSLQEPWAWRSDNGDVFADLQLLAKNIAKYLGLTNVTIAVAIAKQRQDIAGHIELLKRRGEVFIEVDDDLLRHPSCVPAVICHEVMHKVLYEAAVWLDDAAENEKLTDIACVYAGLGKLMLNGCASSGWDHEGREHTFCVGYVPRDGLAFDHAVICQMRNIDPMQADLYLQHDAAEAVRYWRAQLAPLLECLGGTAKFQGDLEAVIENTQAILCERERDIRLCLRLFHEELAANAELHRRMNSAHNAIANFKVGNTTGEHFLRGVSALHLKESLSGADSGDKRSFGAKLALALSRELSSKGAPGHSEIIECPIDGTRLRVPSGKAKIRVLCPSCQYRFLVSTSNQHQRKGLRFFP